jgi:hypothetical protein
LIVASIAQRVSVGAADIPFDARSISLCEPQRNLWEPQHSVGEVTDDRQAPEAVEGRRLEVCLGFAQGGVEDHETTQPFASIGHCPDANRPTPVLHYQDQIIESEFIDQPPKPVDVIIEGVRRRPRLVGEAQADQVGHDHPHRLAGKCQRYLAIEKAPAGVAVHAQHRPSLADLHHMVAVSPASTR